MNFDLTAEQSSFREVLREFVDREIVPVARVLEQSGEYPTQIVRSFADMGLFGMLVPAAHGGLEMDAVSYSLVFEEVSRGWMGAAGILGSHSLATNLIARFGTEAQQSMYLSDLATGVRRSGLALTEPSAGSDLQGISATAVKDGNAYILNGTKTWITNARYADPLPVLCKTDPSASPRHRGMSILLVDADIEGYAVTRDIPKLGYKGPESCEIVFQNVQVPADRLLGGEEGLGLQQALAVLEVGRVNIAARSVGLAQASFDAALKYSHEREAFGNFISSYQAVQMKLADMATDVQTGRLLTRWAATRLDSGSRSDIETGMAKLWCSEMAIRTALTAMRIHGGYGYSTDFEVERYYRDAPLMAIGEGTSDILRLVIAKGLYRRGGLEGA